MVAILILCINECISKFLPAFKITHNCMQMFFFVILVQFRQTDLKKLQIGMKYGNNITNT